MVVLDTHAWLWWVADPDRLSDRAAEVIAGAGTIGVAAISCWELAMLHVKGRITLATEPRAWIRRALGQPGVMALALEPRIAIDAALLSPGEFAGDPADRLIYATARAAGVPLVTRDARLREFDPRGTLW